MLLCPETRNIPKSPVLGVQQAIEESMLSFWWRWNSKHKSNSKNCNSSINNNYSNHSNCNSNNYKYNCHCSTNRRHRWRWITRWCTSSVTTKIKVLCKLTLIESNGMFIHGSWSQLRCSIGKGGPRIHRSWICNDSTLGGFYWKVAYNTNILNSTRYEGWCQVTTRETSSTTTAPAASSQTGLFSPLPTARSRSRPMRGTECLDAKYLILQFYENRMMKGWYDYPNIRIVVWVTSYELASSTWGSWDQWRGISCRL